MKDVTEKYTYVLQAFECDMTLARDGKHPLELDFNNEKVLKDINLLEELSFELRHGNAKIVQVKEDEDISTKRLKKIISNLLYRLEERAISDNISEIIKESVEQGDFTMDELKIIDNDIYKYYKKWWGKE